MLKRYTREELAELKLRRLLDQNQKLKIQAELPLLPVSDASQQLIDYCADTYDPLLPSIWGTVQDDPFRPHKSKWACCSVM
ncbi:hypothetical protein BCR42DRAFT_412992 [Absidia repens]|uniref:Guanine nucleotide-binding protein subunit gamma n=1 Tax=Absidia repens TaxID=90262 RepID=A0A1X2IKI3_9FUNG|nr:hypothetical protein BCR42DRAFT_412992 [Absidia repens]